MTFLPIVAREMYVAARRPSTYWTRVGAAVVGLCIITGLVLLASEIQPAEQGKLLFSILASMAFAYCLFAGASVTADCLSEEKREGTLGLLFLTDLRGYDVVFGKLAAFSLRSVYGLLAVVPMLALAMLLGGVSAGEMARVVGALINTLFFSLAAGVFVSTLSRNDRKAMFASIALIVFVTGAPLCTVAIYWSVSSSSTPFAGPERMMLLPSPIFAFGIALADRVHWLREYLLSLVSTHLLGWGLLAVSSAVLPRVCRDRPRTGQRFRRWEKWQRWNYGSAATRAAVRARLLDRNPILWLAGRDRLKAKLVWVFLGAMAVIWIPAAVAAVDIAVMAAVFVLFCAHLVLKVWLVSEVCTRWIEDRRSGALELLLSSPLSVLEIAAGQRLALRSQFAKSVSVILALDFIFLSFAWRSYHDPSAPKLAASITAGMVALVADLVTLRWVAMWLALTSKNMSRALSGAWIRVLALPWLICLGLYWSAALFCQLTGQPEPQLSPWTWAASWLGLGLALDLIFGWQAKRNVLNEFRAIAAERFAPRRQFSLSQVGSRLIQRVWDGLRGLTSPSRVLPHPGPLPLGEGEFSTAKRQNGCARNDETRQSVLPIPAGEGRGEGESPSHSSDSGFSGARLGLVLRRHAWLWSLLAVVLLGLGWFGWYRLSTSLAIKEHLAGLQKAGQPVSEPDLATWHPPIPIQENAAAVVARATAFLYGSQWLPVPLRTNLPGLMRTEWVARTAPIPSEQKEAMAAYVTSNRVALAILREAVNLRKSRYDSAWSRTQINMWGPFGRVHEIMQLLRLEAVWHSEEDRPEQAIQSLTTLLALTRSLAAEPLLSARYPMNNGLSGAAQVMEHLLTRHALSDRQLQDLSNRMQELEFPNGLWRALAGHRYLQLAFHEMPPQRLLAVSMGVTPAPNWMTLGMGVLQGLYSSSGLRDRDLLIFLQTMDRYLEVAQLPFPESFPKAHQLPGPPDNYRGLPFRLMRQLLPSLPSVLVLEAEKEARRRALLAALALERWRLKNQNRLPETLQQLVPDYSSRVPIDPFDLKPLRYKRLERGYVIYSVGFDGKDDGGRAPERRGKSQTDLTFTVER
ncbi:MAG: ABC transporter permease [Verrucomicrobia bacterium]|nr:ABC transporter permease [Verrucomicrobiota bacterium]